MKKVYIAGRITGTDDYRERFAKAEEEARVRGYEPINPVAIPRAEELPYEEVMERCKELVASADFLYLLNGWEWSNGAIEELKHFMATHNREEMRVFYEHEGLPEITCRMCLYSLPDAYEFVCVCEESERYNDPIDLHETCGCWHFWRLRKDGKA